MIGLLDCPRMQPLKKTDVPDWNCRLSPHGALLTRRCSGVDSWIVPTWRFKKKEMSQIGLMDGPRVEP